MEGSAGMDTYFMYEPVFGLNVATGELICILGESIEWTDSTTITITLRAEPYWNDGTPITSADVLFSYKYYGAYADWTGPSSGGMSALQDSVSSWEAPDDTTIIVHLEPEYADSVTVYRQLTRSYLIVPKHVWELIEAEYPGAELTGFLNDWGAADFPEEWKVASGMYLPYWHDEETTIIERNEDWWGQDVFGSLPAAEYFSHIRYPTNTAAALGFMSGDVDWFCNFIADMDQIKVDYPNCGTYYNDLPYFYDTKSKLLVPNHRKYPLNEPWLHEAMAMVLDYSAISASSSGYLKSPTNWFYLSEDDALSIELVTDEMAAAYPIVYDVDGAIAILEEHCIKVGDTWYTKDGPSAEWLALYGDDAIVPDDALPDEDGINVPLGPWTIMDQLGWSDVNAIDVLACSMLTDGLGITFTPNFCDWSTCISNEETLNFDFNHYVMHMGIGNTMPERYREMFIGTLYSWNHFGDFRNADIEDLLLQMDTLTGDERQATADQILTIVGDYKPFIPFGGHPEWYVYNTTYWSNWAGEDNPWIPAACFGGSTQVAVLQKILFGLIPTPAPTTAPPTTITITQTAAPTTITTTGPGGETITTVITGGVTTVAPAETTWVWVGVIVGAVIVIALVVIAMGRKGK
jgi:peptide/nickel transport system substrate-binding protein